MTSHSTVSQARASAVDNSLALMIDKLLMMPRHARSSASRCSSDSGKRVVAITSSSTPQIFNLGVHCYHAGSFVLSLPISSN